ncbi:unnamed protein product [Ceutorhynchus assimilis]|uniref:Uncharacterized protein n=1 Tax=Ceutorhynchus assimilis TaxID=467358 RepID=A0A9N9QN12_9CUCU|nr:unnamed protein product [Ceutorhynchus assimilis]
MFEGGEDIHALIFDPGQYSIRVGYAQEDTPRADIPAVIGVAPEAKSNNTASKPADQLKYYTDTTFLNISRANSEMISYMNNGIIENWNLFEKMLDYCYANVIQSSAENHPVFFTDAPLNPRVKREQLTELMFEKYQVPAMYMATNAALAAFANGKFNALVLDSGASYTTAVPILDGLVINNAVVKSPLAGDYITLKATEMLESMGIDLTPAHLIAMKEVVQDQEKPKFIKKTFTCPPTDSWMKYMTKRTVQDFQQTAIQISATSPSHYEFPTGYNRLFNQQHSQLTEGLFNHETLAVDKIVVTSISKCDLDVQPALYHSVVITGGNSLMKGFTERVEQEVRAKMPAAIKLKVRAVKGTTERRFEAWTGGSILASIGTFQQLWVSKRHYEEVGKHRINTL